VNVTGVQCPVCSVEPWSQNQGVILYSPAGRSPGIASVSTSVGLSVVSLGIVIVWNGTGSCQSVGR